MNNTDLVTTWLKSFSTEVESYIQSDDSYKTPKGELYYLDFPYAGGALMNPEKEMMI